MRLSSCKLLADENIPQGLCAYLNGVGIETVSLNEVGVLGKPDSDILRVAFSTGSVVITQDADFGKIVFTTKSDFIGIIYLRPGHIATEFHTKTIHAILSEQLELTPPFILVAENTGEKIKIRLRNSMKV